MSNVRLNWVPPTPASDQRPLSSVEISARVDPSFPFTVLGSVPAIDPPEFLDEDVDAGDWEYQAVVIDVSGARSVATTTTITVTETPPVFRDPDPVSGFVATQE